MRTESDSEGVFEMNDLDDIAEIVDLMFVEGEHPRKIMEVLAENREHRDEIMRRTLRFARIFQLDFIMRCTDKQMRLIAEHAKVPSLVNDLCVWQMLQSGVPISIKNMFRHDDGAKNGRQHPWGHGTMFDCLDWFETEMTIGRKPSEYRFPSTCFDYGFLKQSLYQARIFQDDFFFSVDEESRETMIESAKEFGPEISLPFYAQLIERGDAHIRTRISLLVNSLDPSQSDRRYGRSGMSGICYGGWERSSKYRMLFYGTNWMDNAICNRNLEGAGDIRCRCDNIRALHKFTRGVNLNDDLLQCHSYEEYQLKRAISGRRILKKHIAAMVGLACTQDGSQLGVLTGLVRHHADEVERFFPLREMMLRVVHSSLSPVADVSLIRKFLLTLESVRPGLVSGFKDAYGGNLTFYLGSWHCALNGLPIEHDVFKVLEEVGCRFDDRAANGCSTADYISWFRSCADSQ